MQSQLFGLLKESIEQNAPALVHKNIRFLRPNASIHNFGFRGYRLKFDGLYPGKEADFRWVIYYDRPDLLICERGKSLEVLQKLSISQTTFFDLAQEQQKSLLEVLIRLSLTEV